MEVFFDTSVLVAASDRSHPHYEQAHPAMRRAAQGDDKGFICAHSIAETFTTLTRMPVQPRILPMEALRIVTDNILPHFTAVPLEREDYLRALDVMGSGGFSGAKIYDALLLQCAGRCKVKRIYTFNLSDFRKLAGPKLQSLIQAPGASA